MSKPKKGRFSPEMEQEEDSLTQIREWLKHWNKGSFDRDLGEDLVVQIYDEDRKWTGLVDNAQQFLIAELGKPVGRHELPPFQGPSARDISTFTDGERWVLLKEIAGDVHMAARVAPGNARIGHFEPMLRKVTEPSRLSNWKNLDELVAVLNPLLEAFLLVADTLPVFDIHNGSARARMTEKRTLAAAFLVKGMQLWVPLDGSLAEGSG